MSKKGIFSGVLLGISLAIFASDPDTLKIDEVVVTGNRIGIAKVNAPMSISVISKEEINSQEGQNILPIVARVTPGVFISEIGVSGYALGNNTSGQLTIRGVGGSPNSRILILVDGQPQYMGIFGHPLPNFHMTSNIERVEVIRGPASLLYGSNAMGGVINMITKQNKEEGLSVTGRAAYGSFNTMRTGATVNYSKKGFSAGASYNFDQTDGHRDTSAFNMNNLHFYASYNINENWKLRGGFTYADYHFEDPGSNMVDASIAFLGDISRNMATVSLTNNYDRTRGGIYTFLNNGTHDFSDGWHSEDENTGINMYQSVDLIPSLTLTSGIDLKYYGGKGSSGMMADTFLTVHEVAAYLLAEQKIGELIDLSLGARYENNSSFGGELVPQAGITVKPVNSTTVKGIISKGFRSPTIMELYLFAPNPELEPERVWNYELSISKRIKTIAVINLSAYIMKGNGLIMMMPNLNPGPPMIRYNIGEFKNRGLELESSIFPLKSLRLDLNYSFLNCDVRTYFAPSHQLFSGLKWNYGRLEASLNLKYIGGLYTFITDIPSEDILENYLLLDSKVNLKIKKSIDVYIAGKNLLNQEYQTVYGYPMPGIHFIGGVRVKLSNLKWAE